MYMYVTPVHWRIAWQEGLGFERWGIIQLSSVAERRTRRVMMRWTKKVGALVNYGSYISLADGQGRA